MLCSRFFPEHTKRKLGRGVQQTPKERVPVGVFFKSIFGPNKGVARVGLRVLCDIQKNISFPRRTKVLKGG